MGAKKLAKMITVGARLDIALVDEIDNLAEEAGRTRSYMISEALKVGVPVLKASFETFKKSRDEELATAIKSLSASSTTAPV